MHRLDAGKLSMFSGGLVRQGVFRDLDPPVSLSSGLLPRCDPVTFHERDRYLISLWLESRPGRNHPYDRYAVLHSAPEEGIAAAIPAARASVFLEQKQRLERCATRSWPRS